MTEPLDANDLIGFFAAGAFEASFSDERSFGSLWRQLPGISSERRAHLEARYDVQGLLGRGGMGVVLACRERSSGRELAVKVLIGDGQRRLLRFHREGELTACLRHPGIVRVHAAEALEGMSLLIYERVSGARALDEAWIHADLEQRLEWIRQIAEALAFAHGEGITHRDVKPSNVLVDEDGQARVIDFGIAMAENAERLTMTGAALGTPRYAAPEQLQGNRDAQGPATDVWALGCLLYEALTDAPPFDASNTASLMVAILSPPRRPRSREPSVPPALERVCLKALGQQPEQRYPDAGAFAAALAAARLPARPRWPLAAVGAALLAGLGLALAAALVPDPQPTPVVEPSVSAPPTVEDPQTPPTEDPPAQPAGEDPQAYARWLAEARAHVDGGDDRAAVFAYGNAIRAQRTPLALVERGQARVRLGEIDAAIADYEAGIALYPEDVADRRLARNWLRIAHELRDAQKAGD